MKSEIVRMSNFNVNYSTTIKLTGISLCLLAGESIGFLGLVHSGKDLLINIICGNHEVDDTNFYIDGRNNLDSSEIQKLVYKITYSNYDIDDWTVAEYICLVNNGSIFGLLKTKRLVKQAAEYIEKLKLKIDVNKKIKNLTELEKRLVDLVKGYSRNVKILVIEDEFEGCSTQDIEYFKEILNRVMEEGMAAVINSHSDNVSYILSDKYVIFKKGRIVKKCSKDYIKDGSHLEEFLLSSSTGLKKKDLDRDKAGMTAKKDILYSIKGIILRGDQSITFDFYKGEVVTILALDVKEKKRIFELLSGRFIDRKTQIMLGQKNCNFYDITDFVKNKIVSAADMGGESELLLSMSVGNNLLMPSLEKIPALQHMFLQNKVVKMLEKEVNSQNKSVNVKDKSVNDNIILLLERWYIYNPKVLILFEPFIYCDVYGVSLIKSYIKKFTDLGTAVIIVKSREEYIEDISDRIINIDI